MTSLLLGLVPSADPSADAPPGLAGSVRGFPLRAWYTAVDYGPSISSFLRPANNIAE